MRDRQWLMARNRSLLTVGCAHMVTIFFTASSVMPSLEPWNVMLFADAPVPSTRLMPGMFALHERAMCRRRAAGDLAWNWNTGLASPVLPVAGAPCD